MAIFENPKNILWWGRFDPEYSRNRILRYLLSRSGYLLQDFRPHISTIGGVESMFAGLKKPDLIWLPAFRQKDYGPARRYANNHGISLVFDPLISAWDKVVFERKKYVESNRRARRLLQWEQSMFSQADIVIADTIPHGNFFIKKLLAPEDSTFVVPVGAEEPLFSPQAFNAHGPPFEILFFGSFIHLQGTEVIIDAAIQVPEARWTLIGNGPLRKVCEQKSAGHSHIGFEDWHPYEQLAKRIGKADILLGIFGSSEKSARVIPNKVYQAIACGRPVITRESPAYPRHLIDEVDGGITFIPAADHGALAGAVRKMISSPKLLDDRGRMARKIYDSYFSNHHVNQALMLALTRLHW